MNRQKLILCGLIALLILVVIWSYARMPRQTKVKTLTFTSGSRAVPSNRMDKAPASKNVGTLDPVSLQLELLDRDLPDFKGYRRDIFKPVFVDDTKEAYFRSPIETRSPVFPPAALQQPVAEEPRSELAKFTFLGFLQKDGRKIIFLSKDNEIILVKKGDVFAGRYEASVVTDQVLTISVTDTGEQIVIPLVEYSTLRAES